MYNFDKQIQKWTKQKIKVIKTAAVSKVDVEAKDGVSVTEEEWNFCSLKVGTYFYFFEGGHLLFFWRWAPTCQSHSTWERGSRWKASASLMGMGRSL